uniref:SFRICE_011852 n=1 Tax=Spodoptera frugiperda TaxID=7108 RepID=A0A2H1V987_SPOFR
MIDCTVGAVAGQLAAVQRRKHVIFSKCLMITRKLLVQYLFIDLNGLIVVLELCGVLRQFEHALVGGGGGLLAAEVVGRLLVVLHRARQVHALRLVQFCYVLENSKRGKLHKDSKAKLCDITRVLDQCIAYALINLRKQASMLQGVLVSRERKSDSCWLKTTPFLLLLFEPEPRVFINVIEAKQVLKMTWKLKLNWLLLIQLRISTNQKSGASKSQTTTDWPSRADARADKLIFFYGLKVDRASDDYLHSRDETQYKRCFTSVFCEAMVSLRLSQPRRAGAWLNEIIYYDNFTYHWDHTSCNNLRRPRSWWPRRGGRLPSGGGWLRRRMPDLPAPISSPF